MVYRLIFIHMIGNQLVRELYHFEISEGRVFLSGNVVSIPRGAIVVSTPSSGFSPLHSNAKAVITSVTSRMINNTVIILKEK